MSTLRNPLVHRAMAGNGSQMAAYAMGLIYLFEGLEVFAGFLSINFALLPLVSFG